MLRKWLSSPALLSEGASIELFRLWSCPGRPHAAAVAARAYAQGYADGKEEMHFELGKWQSADHHRGCGYQPCSAAKGHSPQAPGTVGVEIEIGRGWSPLRRLSVNPPAEWPPMPTPFGGHCGIQPRVECLGQPVYDLLRSREVLQNLMVPVVGVIELGLVVLGQFLKVLRPFPQSGQLDKECCITWWSNGMFC